MKLQSISFIKITLAHRDYNKFTANPNMDFVYFGITVTHRDFDKAPVIPNKH